LRVHFDRAAPAIIVPTTLVGPSSSKKLDLVLDTGATVCVISPKAAWAVGIAPIPGGRSKPLTTVSGVIHAPLVTIPEVRLGAFGAKGIETVLHELPPTAGVDGLLGLSFLRRFHLAIDFERGFLDLTDGHVIRR